MYMYTSLSNIAFPFPVRGVSAIWKLNNLMQFLISQDREREVRKLFLRFNKERQKNFLFLANYFLLLVLVFRRRERPLLYLDKVFCIMDFPSFNHMLQGRNKGQTFYSKINFAKLKKIMKRSIKFSKVTDQFYA